MTRFFRNLIATTCGCAALVACTTPSATYINWVDAQKPVQANQFSDVLVGRYASLTNDPVLAAETLLRASDREPDDAVLLERAVFALLLAGETDKAVDLAQKAEKRSLELSSLTRLTLGVADVSEGKYETALATLDQSDAGLFNRIVSKSVSAWAAFGTGDLDAAKNYLVESLVGDDILDGVSLYMLALLQMSAGDDEEALETFEAVWNERMRLAVACEHYVRLLSSKGETEKALKVTQEFREDVGENPAVEALAQRLAAGEKLKVKRLKPADGAALAVYAQATALAMETRDDVSSVYFNLALQLNPGLDIARTMLGSTLDMAERREEAITVLNRVPENSPFYATAQSQLSWALMRLGEEDAAIETALLAYDKTSDRDLAIQLGDLYRSQEDYEKAFVWFDKVVKADEAVGEADWRAYYARAVTYAELDNWAPAEADLMKAVELNPKQPQVLNYLGYMWVDRGENLEEAFDLIQDAVALSPGSGYIVDSLGWAYYRLGQYEQAVLYLERAVELSPDDPTLNDHLGDAYWRVGRELEARFQWRHALALEPEASDIPAIQAKLDDGLAAAPPSFLAEDRRVSDPPSP